MCIVPCVTLELVRENGTFYPRYEDATLVVFVTELNILIVSVRITNEKII
jgi:hypothetical protein